MTNIRFLKSIITIPLYFFVGYIMFYVFENNLAQTITILLALAATDIISWFTART